MILNQQNALVNFEPWNYLESITLEETELRKLKSWLVNPVLCVTNRA